MQQYIRHGQGAVRPYVHGPVEIVEFLVKAFGAEEIERYEFDENSFHAEFRIGDSVIVVEAGDLPEGVPAWLNTVYVYVPDVDAAYNTAISLGAESMSPPNDRPYLERQAAIRDETGNIWWISTFTG